MYKFSCWFSHGFHVIFIWYSIQITAFPYYCSVESTILCSKHGVLLRWWHNILSLSQPMLACGRCEGLWRMQCMDTNMHALVGALLKSSSTRHTAPPTTQTHTNWHRRTRTVLLTQLTQMYIRILTTHKGGGCPCNTTVQCWPTLQVCVRVCESMCEPD